MSRRQSGRPIVRAGQTLLAAGLGLAVVLWASGCGRGAREPATPGPLAKTKPADNSHCFVCHKDFQAEELTVQHSKQGIACDTCHGLSWAHGDDEFNIVRPDVKYGRAEIDPFCKGCHPTHKKGKVYDDFVKKWSGRYRPNGRMLMDNPVCTDCHGNHAILSADKQLELRHQ